MRSWFSLLVATTLLATSAIAEEPSRFSHAIFDRVLGRYVNENGLVDYGSLKNDRIDLDRYLTQLAQFSPEATPALFPTRADSLAYWINAYNAFAIGAVVEAYPTRSVRDIKWFYGFFNRISHTAGGKEYKLKHIENEIVRKQFEDPRVHAALNCASMGCPQLPQEAFKAEKLDAQLETEMQFFLREKRNVRIDRQDGRIHLSHILKEFEGDFTDWYTRTHGGDKATILDYLQLYLSKDEAAYLEQHPDLAITYPKYDWRLNDQVMKR